MAFEGDLNLEATELRLGLPGTADHDKKTSLPGAAKNNKRGCPESPSCDTETYMSSNAGDSRKLDCPESTTPPAKAQVVGWPPIRSYRKNCLQPKKPEPEPVGVYVKVSMDGVPYLRKIDLKLYKGYPELLHDLEDMFKFKAGEYSEREGYNRSEFVPTYEDKDGDWMLVGDVPWNMFIASCKRLRVMKGSDAL